MTEISSESAIQLFQTTTLLESQLDIFYFGEILQRIVAQNQKARFLTRTKTSDSTVGKDRLRDRFDGDFK